ncbi:MAG TPA: hypothetical protein VHQ41_01115 [Patescibacteria group bacterium]|jgi:hypothetical protein|nr:hypothetical protein [Patescibacteria group bacterium]
MTNLESQSKGLAPLTDRQMLEEIYEQTRKTKNYMKWQLIITVALVVIPLLATIAVIPFAMKSLESVYSSYGLDSLSNPNGGDGSGAGSSSVQDLLKQYSK